METTGKSLVEHWNWAAKKGLMNNNSAAALRAACTQVLGVLDDWQSIDVTTIDTDDVVKRFKHLRAKDFKPKSLDTYEKRFKNALASYLDYVGDPGGWKPASHNRAAKVQRNGGGEREADASGAPPRTAVLRPGLVDYPFPLRDGQTARLMLPRDLKLVEVKRLSAFMATLAVDSPAE